MSTSSEVLGGWLGCGLLIPAAQAWDQTWLGMVGAVRLADECVTTHRVKMELETEREQDVFNS